jgi:hypothetical protein
MAGWHAVCAHAAAADPDDNSVGTDDVPTLQTGFNIQLMAAIHSQRRKN